MVIDSGFHPCKHRVGSRNRECLAVSLHRGCQRRRRIPDPVPDLSPPLRPPPDGAGVRHRAQHRDISGHRFPVHTRTVLLCGPGRRRHREPCTQLLPRDHKLGACLRPLLCPQPAGRLRCVHRLLSPAHLLPPLRDSRLSDSALRGQGGNREGFPGSHPGPRRDPPLPRGLCAHSGRGHGRNRVLPLP